MVSSIGVPIIMDRMTTSICEKPYGRASFARVLVEIDSSKALVDNVELWYESLGKILRLRVEYTWVPPRCEECKVYGHYVSECVKKVNTVSKVTKDGENIKAADKEKGTNSDEVNNGDEGWHTVGNRRNNRGAGNNVRQGSVGSYNVRRGFNNYRGDLNNRGNYNGGNAGNRDANKKSVSVSNGNTGKVDECVVINENGENANKGKSKANEAGTSTTGNSVSGSDDRKKNMVENNSGNKNDMVADKGKKSAMGRKSGDEVSGKVGAGAKNVAACNCFDLLRDDSASEEPDPWKEVKESVVVACNTGVPIAEDFLKGWNADMIKFYSVKWNNRANNSGHVKQQLDNEMKILVSQIVQLNRNLNKNSKLNAEKLLKESVVANQNVNDVSVNKFYDVAYRAELAKIEELQKEKNLIEVELFLLSNQPLDNDHKDIKRNESTSLLA
ncbi:zinc knuckle CX2CX4HX4C [Artemisia annua]|uniref:Zinc knuckle CX2CX4HX4C n=1 Tax=Artemisia annua TaxID=35608 RepID=A0A2U1KRK4_ARTAN|nr:zinc knuckle CX2CX4HX4C [Artemisia annua]